MYDIYLGGLGFYGIEDTNFKHDRKLVIYNGIGTGYFPKADDPNLRKWSWNCELQERPEHYHNSFTPATSIKSGLDAMLESKEPVRLVVSSTDGTNLSEEVFLEDYNFKEIYSGVYSVSVNVTEYKAAAVRSTNIPEIPRPGKLPEVKPFNPNELKPGETPYDKGNDSQDSWTDNTGSEDFEHAPGAGPHDPFEDLEGNPVNPVDPGDKPIFWQDPTKSETINNITGEKVEYNHINTNWDKIGNTLFPGWRDSALGKIVEGYQNHARMYGPDGPKPYRPETMVVPRNGGNR